MFELFSLSVGGNRAPDRPADDELPADEWVVISSYEEDGPIVISSDEEEAGEYEAGEYEEARLNGFVRRFVYTSDEEEAGEEEAGEYEAGEYEEARLNGFVRRFVHTSSDEEEAGEEEAGEYDAGEYEEARFNGFVRRFVHTSSDEEEAGEQEAGENEVGANEVGIVNENVHRRMAPVGNEDSESEDDEDDLRELDIFSDSDFFSSGDSGYSSMDDSGADSEDDQRLPRNRWFVRGEFGWQQVAPPSPPRPPAVPEHLIVRAPEERPGEQEDDLDHPSDSQGCEECAPSTSGFFLNPFLAPSKRSREEDDHGQEGSKRQRLDLEGSQEEPAPSTSGLGSSTNRSSFPGPLHFPRFYDDSDSD